MASESIIGSFKKHEIVPQIIDTEPNYLLEVKYENDITLLPGKVLTPTQVKNVPIKTKWPIESNIFYTLCMTDPDAPTRNNPIYGEVKHWLVVNILGNDIQKGDTLAEYIGSGAPEGTGLHRYVFLVFRQPNKIDVSNIKKVPNTSRNGRISFKIRKFAQEYNLGNPIAGNFFQAEWDEYVPILKKQLSGT